MTWVRNPWWDGFWLLSGLPIGIALMLFVPSPHIWYMALTIMVLETGHVVAPMILAWSKSGLRAIVWREWERYIAVPIALFAACLLLPSPIVFGVYFTWNIWHFGMQIFGISCLYHRPRSSDARVLRALACLLVTIVGMGLLPLFSVSPAVYMLMFGIFSFNHWLADIGLSSQVSGWRWGFIPLVLVLGLVWFVLRQGPLSTTLIPQILAIRAAIGMTHFIYSARIWKVRDIVLPALAV